MAYDEDLAARIRELIGSDADVTEQRMFGGLAFLAGGSMAVAVSGKGGLMVRCEPAETDALLARAGRGRVRDARAPAGRLAARGRGRRRRPRTTCRAWVDRGVRYARSLPAR
jgi:hypothetical protein